MHFLWHIFRNMSNSFSIFVFRRNCILIMYERWKFVFITGIQNFSKFRLPRGLQKVEPTNTRLHFKWLYNNQRNFFICIFNNHFNRRKHFVCFVSYTYHCTLLISVVLFLFKEIQTCLDSMSWFETQCFERTLCQGEELYSLGKQKAIRWKASHKNEYLTFLQEINKTG